MLERPIRLNFFNRIKGLAWAVCPALAGVLLWAGVNLASEWPLRVHFVDVGYADAILLELPDTSTILVDAGEEKTAVRLLTYLRQHHITQINTAVITHPHRNHFAGFKKIATRIPISRVFHNGGLNAEEGYSDLLQQLKQKHIPVDTLSRGQKMDGLPDTVTVTVLNPPTEMTGNPNDDAIVLWVKYGQISLILAADIGPQRQEELLKAFADIRQAQGIQVPHHGGPLSDVFIEAFQGKTFFISTGPNRWGLPHEDQLKELNGTVYRTDRDGTIVVESDGNTLKIVSWTKNGN